MDIKDYKKTPIENVMSTDFLSVQIDTPIDQMIQEFHQLNDKSTAIAVFEGDKYIGLIEPLTLIKLLVDVSKIADEKILNIRGVDFAYFPKTTADLVYKYQIKMSGKETVSQAATLMLKSGLTRLAVEQNGKLVGIVKASGLFDKLSDK